MSLLVRLFFVVAVALLPVVLVEVVDGIEHRRETETALHQGAIRLATVVGESEGRILQVMRRYLGHVAAIEAVQTQSPQCGAALARQANPYPGLAYLALFTRAGVLVCATDGAALAADAPREPFFRRALETGAFAIGDFAPTPAGGVLRVAEPVVGGKSDGVLVAALSLKDLTEMIPSGAMPAGASLVIADSDGTVLAALPADGAAAGSRLPASERALIHTTGVGSIDGSDTEGRDRIYGYAPISIAPDDRLFVEVGLDRDRAYAAVEAEGRMQIIALNGALALGIFVAWLCGRRFIARPAAQLVSAAERWREGDWSARTALNDPDSEFGRLSIAFDAMADAVSDRERRLKDALIEVATANQTKTDFLATMNHELRTPLNPILGLAELMLEEIHGPLSARYRDYANDIKQCGEHLLGVVDRLMDLSRAVTGRLVLAETEADPVAVVTSALRAVEAQAVYSGLAFTLETAPDLPMLRCDWPKLKQMVTQILGNAIKFTPSGGRIAVAVACRADELVIAVRDTGAGIAPEHLTRVVEPFFRVHDTYIRGQEGAGLGLALVTAMAELHGGRLELASELGKGTVASIVFPADRLLPRASQASEAA